MKINWRTECNVSANSALFVVYVEQLHSRYFVLKFQNPNGPLAAEVAAAPPAWPWVPAPWVPAPWELLDPAPAQGNSAEHNEAQCALASDENPEKFVVGEQIPVYPEGALHDAPF